MLTLQDIDRSRLKDVSVPIAQIVAQSLGLSMALLAAPLVIFGVARGFGTLLVAFTGDGLLLVLVGVLVALVLHEGVHALGWIVFARLAPTQIRFGVDRKTLSPYAHALAAMPVQGYRVGTVLPLILVGIVPLIIAVIAGSGVLAVIAAVMISGAVGDIVVLWIIRGIPASARVLDHPSQAGCYVVLDEDRAGG